MDTVAASEPANNSVREAHRDVVLIQSVRVLVVLAALISGLTVISWFTADMALQQRWPSLFLMKVNAAVGVLALSVALFGVSLRIRPWQRASSLLSAAVVVAGLIQLAQYLSGIDFGIDQLLARDYTPAAFPGRTSWPSLSCFLLIGTGIWLESRSQKNHLSPALFYIASAIPIAAFSGYLYHAPDLSLEPRLPVLSLQTSLCSFFLCVGGLLIRPRSSLANILVSDSVAGSMARKLIPAAVMLPVAAGSLVLLGERLSLYSGELGSAMLVSACALFFAGAVWVTSTVLLRAEKVRRQSEIFRMAAERRLVEGEQRLRIALDTAKLGTWEFDVNTGELITSSQCRANYGFGSDDAFDYAALLACIADDDRERVTAAAARAATGESDYYEQYQIRWPDGSAHWVVASGRILQDDLGAPSRMVGVSLDVTDRKRAEEELLLADRRKDEFLATLAHELRNPLAPIRQAATIARTRLSSAPQRDWALDVIDRQTSHMAVLLDDLLEMSRITRGHLHLRKEWADLDSIVKTALETANPIMESKHQRLSVDVPAAALRLFVDPVRVAQILSNLLINAAKYSDADAAVALIIDADADHVRFTVRDTGIGIAPEMLSKIFVMFSQVERALARSDGGLGIGLALVKGLTELHQGTVTATSAGLGTGSEFTVSLPRVPEKSPHQPDELPAAQPGTACAIRILIADDNRDAADSMQMLLELEGHIVRTAHDGEAALGMAEEFGPDVMLLDLGMPKLNGFDVARRIRQQPRGADIVLIAVTGWGQPDDRRRSADAGFDHHMTKPVQFEQLLPLFATKRSPAA